MKKIICFSHSIHEGGAALAFNEMLCALHSKGYEVYGVFPFPGKLVEDCEPYMKEYYIFSLPWWYEDKLSIKGKIKQSKKLFIPFLR